MFTLIDLPNELIVIISKHLSIVDIARFRRCTKSIDQLIFANSAQLPQMPIQLMIELIECTIKWRQYRPNRSIWDWWRNPYDNWLWHEVQRSSYDGIVDECTLKKEEMNDEHILMKNRIDYYLRRRQLLVVSIRFGDSNETDFDIISSINHRCTYIINSTIDHRNAFTHVTELKFIRIIINDDMNLIDFINRFINLNALILSGIRCERNQLNADELIRLNLETITHLHITTCIDNEHTIEQIDRRSMIDKFIENITDNLSHIKFINLQLADMTNMNVSVSILCRFVQRWMSTRHLHPFPDVPHHLIEIHCWPYIIKLNAYNHTSTDFDVECRRNGIVYDWVDHGSSTTTYYVTNYHNVTIQMGITYRHMPIDAQFHPLKILLYM